MGHISNAIAVRLGGIRKHVLSWVAFGKNYKIYFQYDLLIIRIIKNALNNYENPDFSRAFLRNNKNEDNNKSSVNKVYFCIHSVVLTAIFQKNTRDIIYHGKPVFTRTYKDWAVNQPVGNAIELKKEMEYSEKLGGYLLKITDFSGKKHKLLVKAKENQFLRVLGAFTSSSTAYKDIHPDLVCSYNLEDDNKSQIFHKYLNAVFIKKSDVTYLKLETAVLEDVEYRNFCAALENKKT